MLELSNVARGWSDVNHNLSGGVLLHPNIIARIGGEPASLVLSAQSPATAVMLTGAARLRESLEARRTDLCAALEEAYRDLAELGLGRDLIQLKRDLYNCRSPRRDAALLAALSVDLRTQVSLFADDADCLAGSVAGLVHCYAGEIDTERDALRALWKHDNLRTAILCSNRFLYEQLAKQLEQPGPLGTGKKVANACDSLLSYAVRTALKASPLSSFTLIWVGEWAVGGAAPYDFAVDAVPHRRKVELKQAAVLHAIEPLWSDLRMIGDAFPLVINPTVAAKGSQITWTQFHRSTYRHPKVWGHNGPRVNIALSREIQLIFQLFGSTGASVNAAALLETLVRVEGDVTKRRRFLHRLVDMQLLIPQLDRFEQEPLLPWLSATLRAMARELTAPIVAQIDFLQEIADRFADAEESARNEGLREMDAAIAKLVELAGSPATPQALMPAIYEDCFVDRPRFELDPTTIAPVLENCRALLEMVPALDFNHVLQSLFARRFEAQFGVDGVCDRPFDFLNDLAETYFGGESEIDAGRMARLHEEQLSDATGRGIHDVRKRYLDLFTSSPTSCDTLFLDREAVAKIASGLPDSVRARSLSQSFTGQFATLEDGRSLFVVNQVLPGASAMLSRFLTDLDDAELARVRRYIGEVTAATSYAEISAVFGFNANLHPMLADAELQIPGHLNGYRATAKLPLSELTLTLSTQADRLVFRHQGTAIDPVYLGFMTPTLLPRQLRPLMTTSTQNKILYVSREIERLCGRREGDLIVTPRVMFGDICLARRSYIFAKNVRPDASLDDCSFFQAVWHWRHANHLPRHAFWRLLPDHISGSEAQARSPLDGIVAAVAAQSQFDPTAFKPFFIDFDSPASVRLFRRALARNRFDLAIEEALPGPGMHQLDVGGDRYLCEYQFELTRKGMPVR